jgi:hypothetical protein
MIIRNTLFMSPSAKYNGSSIMKPPSLVYAFKYLILAQRKS